MNYKKNILKRRGFYEINQCLSKPKKFTEILRESELNPTTLNRRLHNMMDEDLIEKFIDLADRKAKYRLTSKGEEYKEIIEATTVLEKASKKIEEGGKVSPSKKLLIIALARDEKEINSAFCKAINDSLDTTISEEYVKYIFSSALERISSI